MIKKQAYFHEYSRQEWPDPKWLERFFLTAEGRSQAFGDQESWGLRVQRVDDTEQLEPDKGQIDVDLTIQGDLSHGILLCYGCLAGGRWRAKYSKGDLTKLNQWVETGSGDQFPVGLFIPFEIAWQAIKEFIGRDGALPRAIEWIDDSELPPGMSFVP